MFMEEYSRYTLLSRGYSFSRSLDKRIVILICIIVVPVVLFCVLYATLFGFYDATAYPNSFSSKEISHQNVHRALIYSTFSNKTDLNIVVSQYGHVNNKSVTKKFTLVCYYNFPSAPDALQVENLDPFLCTHINVGFARVVNSSIFLAKDDEDQLAKFVELKAINGNLKVLLSIGGAGGDNGFPDMVVNHTHRKCFIKSVIYYVKKYHLDGIDLDWEFPNEQPRGDKQQRMHFTQLLEELRAAVNRHPNYHFLITVAVAAPTSIIDNSYDVSYINDFVDFINLMSYDYHFYTKMTPFTGINAPLFASSNEQYYLATLNINYSSNYWHYLGMEKSKIVVGLPTYGHSFRLTNSKNKGLYAPAFGYGKLGSLGFIDYNQVCQFLSTNYITPVFDMETKSPYAVKDSEWISFDDPQSLTFKAEYIRDNNFAGAMVYSLNSDDYRGVCSGPKGTKEKFPLTKVIAKILVDDKQSLT